MNEISTAEATSLVRASLQREVLEAQRALEHARWRLEQFDRAMSGTAPRESAQKKYRKGLSAALTKAISAFEGQEFTPAQLLKKVHELTPEGASLFPDVNGVTKTINKMLSNPQCPFVRVSNGAGLKPPRFQLPARTETPARQLPD